MEEPTFDAEGYPTEETLQKIRTWRLTGEARKVDQEAARKLMEFIAKAWAFKDYAKETAPGLWVFHTGGWSGNESLLAALKDNPWFKWGFLDHLEVGAMLIVAISPEAEALLRKKRHELVRWAWHPLEGKEGT